MNEQEIWEARIAMRNDRRQNLTPEERQAEALEDIAEYLEAIETALNRIADR